MMHLQTLGGGLSCCPDAARHTLPGASLEAKITSRVMASASSPKILCHKQRHNCSHLSGRQSVSVSASSGLTDQDKIDRARGKQFSSTDLLASLLQAPNLKATAAESVDSMTEEFFMMASTYLDMAKKEGNKDVVAKLEIVLKAAMSAKQATLRPEIQLLNALLSCKNSEERDQVFRQSETADRLVMNDRYFFTNLLDRMIADVQRAGSEPGAKKASDKQKLLVHQLNLIKEEAKKCLS